MPGPLLTLETHEQLSAARRQAADTLVCSLDLGRTSSEIELRSDHWTWQGQEFPYMPACKERTIYHWNGAEFVPVARFAGSLIKLVPTDWGAPTFEIDGIKMLPTAKVSPYADAERKVGLIQPRGKVILDTCGGLGYFAAWCVAGGARQIRSFEKNPSVVWLRTINPWSPSADAVLSLQEGDIAKEIQALPTAGFDAILHDPPRFGIAGELYAQAFYEQLARVVKARGRLFHYTGSPNKLTSGRDVPNEVAKRLRLAGFGTELIGDGVLAVRR